MRKFVYISIFVLLIATGIAAFAIANDSPANDVNDPAYMSDSINELNQNKNFTIAGLEAKELKEQM